ncbi:MAG: hypothetical protein ACTIOL_02070 [Enterococcus sp.]
MKKFLTGLLVLVTLGLTGCSGSGGSLMPTKQPKKRVQHLRENTL